MKPPHNGRRWLALAAMIGVLGWLGWRIAASTISTTLAVVDPPAAIGFDASDSRALVAAAQALSASALPAPTPTPVKRRATRAQRAALAQASRLARQALVADPLRSSALTELGRIADAQGHEKRAAALMRLAAARALRDPVAQAWLVEHAIARGDFNDALPHLDAILRTHPGAYQKALPLLAAFVAFPGGRAPLVRLLQKDPPWRDWLLTALPVQMASLPALRAFYGQLLAGPNPPKEKEIQPFLARLVKAGDDKDAYAIWAKELPPGRLKPGELLYNADFRHPLSGSEFDWRIDHVAGADFELGSGGGQAGFHVDFSGGRVVFHAVTHRLVLAPGSYRFSGKVRARSLRTARGLRWRIFCAGGQTLGATPLVAASTPWRQFSVAFSVPATGCEGQALQLELAARTALEQRIGGVVAYSDLSLTRVNEAAASGAISAPPK